MEDVRIWQSLNRKDFSIFGAILAVILLIAVYWYRAFPLKCLAADDLEFIKLTWNTGIFESAKIPLVAFKYRPIFSWIAQPIVMLFKTNGTAYYVLNLIHFALNGVLFSGIVYFLTRRNIFYTVLAVGLFATNRFAMYHVVQFNGLMENLTITFLLLLILSLSFSFNVKSFKIENNSTTRTQSMRALLWACFFFGLIIFTHERFILLYALFCVVAILPSQEQLSLRFRSVTLLLPLSFIALNFGIKTWYGSRILTGTETEAIKLKRQNLDFLADGFLNHIGFPKGEPHLSAITYDQSTLTIKIVGWACAILFFLFVIFGLRFTPRFRNVSKLRAAQIVVIFLVSYGALVASASATFRQEFRWLFSGDLVLLLGAFWLINYRSFGVAESLFVLWVAGLLIIAVDAQSHQGRMYISPGLLVSKSACEIIIQPYRTELAGSSIYLLNSSDYLQGYFQKSTFFKLYGNTEDVDVFYSDGSYSSSAAPLKRPSFYFRWDADHFVDETELMRRQRR